MPKISIIITTFNRASMLIEAIESVLAQTYHDWELIVVDDGSSDDTEAVVGDYLLKDKRIKYIYQKNTGIYKARNAGIALSKGEYIAFLDDDDLYLPQKLMRQVEFLEKHQDIGLVYSQVYIFDVKRNKKIIFPNSCRGENFRDLFRNCYIQMNAVMVRRICFEKVGLFRQISLCDDYDMWLRVSRCFKHKGINEPLAIYRRHGNNISSGVFWLYSNIIETLKDVIPDSSLGVSAMVKQERIGRLQYLLALEYIERKDFISAAKEFLRACMSCPYIGLIVEWRKYKLFVYRLIKPYLAIAYCLLKRTYVLPVR